MDQVEHLKHPGKTALKIIELDRVSPRYEFKIGSTGFKSVTNRESFYNPSSVGLSPQAYRNHIEETASLHVAAGGVAPSATANSVAEKLLLYFLDKATQYNVLKVAAGTNFDGSTGVSLDRTDQGTGFRSVEIEISVDGRWVVVSRLSPHASTEEERPAEHLNIEPDIRWLLGRA